MTRQGLRKDCTIEKNPEENLQNTTGARKKEMIAETIYGINSILHKSEVGGTSKKKA